MADDRALTVVRGRDQQGPLRLSADVAVVGSGAGGAVVANVLARQGLRVVVVEEGDWVRPSEYGHVPPTEMMRRCWREGGLSAAVAVGDTPFISILQGKCVGGSSVLTGGVCFRIPEEVLGHWSHRLGLKTMNADAMDAHFRAVEEAVHVETVPDGMRSRSTELFLEGASRRGIPMKSLRRNTSGCRGVSRCNFGCPHGAKLSVDISFLPGACAHGSVILTDAIAERVAIGGGVARGVRGRLLDASGERRHSFEVKAKVVVVACGTLHTPMLLRSSGVDSVHVGRHMTLHPGVRVGAIFEEVVDGWDGSLQSVYSDHFASDGITLVSVYPPPSILSAAFPGVGVRHRRHVHKMPNLAVFGGMIHDEGGGRVRRWIGREPLVTYRMAKGDGPRLLRVIEIIARMGFAAGAREIAMPVFGIDTLRNERELDDFVAHPPDLRRVECTAYHPLGTAKMSADARSGVVRETGEAWQVQNLFVADGSILPTSIGVNSQLPIMSIAHKVASGIADAWPNLARTSA